MPYEDHMEFLDLLRKSMYFAVDEVNTFDGLLTEEDFFEHLYTSFTVEDEKAVKRAVENADRFMIVVAPTGGGKSTILRKAVHDCKNCKRSYFIFDFKEQIENFYAIGKEPDERMLFIRDMIKKELSKHFLNDLQIKIKFVFTALRMFFYEDRLHNLIFKWRAEHSKSDIGNKIDDLEKLFYRDTKAIAKEEKYVKRNLTCAQMISVIKKTLDLKKFLLILDNIDRLTSLSQPQLFSVAIDVHHGGRGDFGTIVAVRNKNLMRYEEAGTAADVIEVVSLTSQTSERTRPIRLHPPTAEFAKILLEKRHSFIHNLKFPEEDRDNVMNSIKYFNKMKPLINNEFIEDRFYNLANHSFRNMFVLNIGFIRYLYRLISDNVIVDDTGELSLDIPNTRSYLYRWMYAIQNRGHEFILDIVTKYDQYLRKVIQDPLECDIELVILAWLINHKPRILRVNDLLNSFETIGVNSKTILPSLYHLYDVYIPYRYIELGDSERHYSFKELCENNLRITLNPLGEEFLRSMVVKLEFLYQCLAFPNVVSEDSREMLVPISKDMDIKITKILDFLNKVRKVHTDSLLKIKDTCSASHPNWEDYYRGVFCVETQLIIERIIISHLSHLWRTHRGSYQKFNSHYKNLLDDYYKSYGSSREATNILYGIER